MQNQYKNILAGKCFRGGFRAKKDELIPCLDRTKSVQEERQASLNFSKPKYRDLIPWPPLLGNPLETLGKKATMKGQEVVW